jgi:hypothetical protein
MIFSTLKIRGGLRILLWTSQMTGLSEQKPSNPGLPEEITCHND